MKNIAPCAIVFLLLSCTPPESGQSIDAAAAEYLGALADGTLDGYLKHEASYRDKANSAKQGIPSDMWTQREASLRETAKGEIRRDGRRNPYGFATNACTAVVSQGATVKVKEVRPTPPGGWQVFYDISYADQGKSPGIVLQNGKYRLFRSGVFSVAFEKSGDGVPVARDYCPAVGGTVATWSVPPLIADEAVRIAKQANVVPTQFTSQVSRVPGVGGDSSWSWQQFAGAVQLLKSTLERHGWSVSGLALQFGYYSTQGNAEPPASAKKWIIGEIVTVNRTPGYNIILLENAETKLLSFTAQEDTATASFSTKFSGCTPFCELWKDVRTIPGQIFMPQAQNNPSFNLDGVFNTSVNFAWNPSRGWYVQR